MTHQRDKLLGALGRIVADVDNLPVLVPFLQELGRDHRKFGTVADHYPAVGASLIATLEHFAGEHWTAELAEQWRLAYQLIADVMTCAAEEAGAVTPAWWEGKVTAHERRRFDIAALTVQVTPELRYQPGQSVAVETALRPKLWRYYSPACAPRVDGTIELHVRAMDGGPVSTALVRELAVGDILRMGAPVGDMTLTHADGRDLLLVAGGTGLAPLKALVDQLIADPDTRRQRRVHLFFGARTAEELYDLPAVRGLVQRHAWLRVVPAAIGVGFGIAASTDRPRVRVAAPVIGYLCAVALHALWNLSAAGGLAGFLVVYGLVMVPLFAAYVGLMIWARRREGRVVAQWLPEYGMAGWFSLDEVARLASMHERRRALVAAGRYGGRAGRRTTRRFQHIATELAFLRNRAGRHSPGPDFADREHELLAALAASRARLPIAAVTT
jgi:NAD(P)H-flavin reductase